MWRLAVSGLALALSACAAGTEPAGSTAEESDAARPRPPAEAFEATVERVVDGDTLVASRQGRLVRARLIGVDAPESVKRDSPVECYGREAAAHLKALLPPGTRLAAAYQGSHRRDPNGRDLWDAWLADGRFVQGELVRAGAAQARVYRPHDAHADYLADLERTARARRAGLHGACR
jgi:micrococcal nuclease